MSEELTRIEPKAATGEVAASKQIVEPEPVFELNRETVSYVIFQEGHRGTDRITVRLKWPEPVAVRQLLDGRNVRYALDGDYIAPEPEDMQPYYDFLSEYLVSVRWEQDRGDGQYDDRGEVPLEKARDLIQRNPNCKWAETILMGGALGVQVKRPEAGDDFASLFDNRIITVVRHWREDQRRWENVQLTHVLGECSADWASRCKRALRMFVRGDRKGAMMTNDALLATELYQERIVRIDNLTIDGAPCDERTRPNWAGEKGRFCKVPYQWIHAVLFEDKEGRQAKSFR